MPDAGVPAVGNVLCIGYLHMGAVIPPARLPVGVLKCLFEKYDVTGSGRIRRRATGRISAGEGGHDANGESYKGDGFHEIVTLFEKGVKQDFTNNYFLFFTAFFADG